MPFDTGLTNYSGGASPRATIAGATMDTQYFEHRNHVYNYVAVDRITRNIAGWSDDYNRICKRYSSERYEIKCRFAGMLK